MIDVKEYGRSFFSRFQVHKKIIALIIIISRSFSPIFVLNFLTYRVEILYTTFDINLAINKIHLSTKEKNKFFKNSFGKNYQEDLKILRSFYQDFLFNLQMEFLKLFVFYYIEALSKTPYIHMHTYMLTHTQFYVIKICN